MRCEEFRAAVHASARVPASPDEQARLDSHVAHCPGCREFLDVCGELTCRELIEFLNLYIDGELDPARREIFERHLAICQDCANYLESYRQTMALSVAALANAPLPPDVPPALVEAILRARKP